MSSPFFFDPTNLLVLPETIIGNFRYADWPAAKQSGVFGILSELVKAATGFNTMAFFIPTGSKKDKNGLEIGNPGGAWDQGSVRALLKRRGVTSWGYGYWNGEMHFRVKKRQADWAQYVMLRAGVPLLHGYVPGSRAIPARGKR